NIHVLKSRRFHQKQKRKRRRGRRGNHSFLDHSSSTRSLDLSDSVYGKQSTGWNWSPESGKRTMRWLRRISKMPDIKRTKEHWIGWSGTAAERTVLRSTLCLLPASVLGAIANLTDNMDIRMAAYFLLFIGLFVLIVWCLYSAIYALTPVPGRECINFLCASWDFSMPSHRAVRQCQSHMSRWGRLIYDKTKPRGCIAHASATGPAPVKTPGMDRVLPGKASYTSLPDIDSAQRSSLGSLRGSVMGRQSLRASIVDVTVPEPTTSLPPSGACTPKRETTKEERGEREADQKSKGEGETNRVSDWLRWLFTRHIRITTVLFGLLLAQILVTVMPHITQDYTSDHSRPTQFRVYVFCVIVACIYLALPHGVVLARFWAVGSGPRGKDMDAAFWGDAAVVCGVYLYRLIQHPHAPIMFYQLWTVLAFLPPAITVVYAFGTSMVQVCCIPFLNRRMQIPGFPAESMACSTSMSMLFTVLSVCAHESLLPFAFAPPLLVVIANRLAFTTCYGWGIAGSPVSVLRKTCLLMAGCSTL
ncbi:hypothetical protein KIPB_008842, partial [Kipferlia bialata]